MKLGMNSKVETSKKIFRRSKEYKAFWFRCLFVNEKVIDACLSDRKIATITDQCAFKSNSSDVSVVATIERTTTIFWPCTYRTLVIVILYIFLSLLSLYYHDLLGEWFPVASSTDIESSVVLLLDWLTLKAR